MLFYKSCFVIFLLLFSMATIAFSQGKIAGKHEKTISVSLIFPKSENKSIISGAANDSTVDVNFVIKNNTDTIAGFFEEWNSWGFYNFGFELITPDTVLQLYRAGGCWGKNFPSAVMLFPGDSLIFPLYIRRCQPRICDCFAGLPAKYLENAEIRAVYQLLEENFQFYMEDVQRSDEVLLFLRSSHRRKMEKLTPAQKIRSFVHDRLLSEKYQIVFLTE